MTYDPCGLACVGLVFQFQSRLKMPPKRGIRFPHPIDKRPRYGLPGSWWLSFGLAVMSCPRLQVPRKGPKPSGPAQTGKTDFWLDSPPVRFEPLTGRAAMTAMTPGTGTSEALVFRGLSWLLVNQLVATGGT